jgi:hypothetical protein
MVYQVSTFEVGTWYYIKKLKILKNILKFFFKKNEVNSAIPWPVWAGVAKPPTPLDKKKIN